MSQERRQNVLHHKSRKPSRRRSENHEVCSRSKKINPTRKHDKRHGEKTGNITQERCFTRSLRQIQRIFKTRAKTLEIRESIVAKKSQPGMNAEKVRELLQQQEWPRWRRKHRKCAEVDGSHFWLALENYFKKMRCSQTTAERCCTTRVEV